MEVQPVGCDGFEDRWAVPDSSPQCNGLRLSRFRRFVRAGVRSRPKPVDPDQDRSAHPKRQQQSECGQHRSIETELGYVDEGIGIEILESAAQQGVAEIPGGIKRSPQQVTRAQ